MERIDTFSFENTMDNFLEPRFINGKARTTHTIDESRISDGLNDREKRRSDIDNTG